MICICDILLNEEDLQQNLVMDEIDLLLFLKEFSEDKFKDL